MRGEFMKLFFAISLSLILGMQSIVIPIYAKERILDNAITEESGLNPDKNVQLDLEEDSGIENEDNNDVDKDDIIISEEQVDNEEDLEASEEEIHVIEEEEFLELIDTDSTAKVALAPDIVGSGIVTATTLNVRSEPSTSKSKIGTLMKDDTVEIVARTRDWYRIKYSGGFGYVSSSYIKLNYFEKGIDVSKWNGNIDWNKWN